MEQLNRKIVEDSYLEYMRSISYLYEYANIFLQEKLGKDFKFPIPIKNLINECKFHLVETQLMQNDHMELDINGGFTTMAKSELYKKVFNDSLKSSQTKENIGERIWIEKNLGENEKRFQMARELSYYLLEYWYKIGPRKENPISRSVFSYFNYPIEILADTLANAILMPYDLIVKEKENYEDYNKYNPLSYWNWINHIEALVQIPQYRIILAYEEIRKIEFYRRMQNENSQVKSDDINTLKREL